MTKEYLHEVETCDEPEYRSYKIKSIGNDWFELTCDDEVIGKMVSEEECRRVIWSYWTNLGVPMEYLEDEDFTVIEEQPKEVSLELTKKGNDKYTNEKGIQPDGR